MNPWETSLYYTFSTISQTVAGAIGLLGAFVLYKFEIINTKLYLVADTILTKYGYKKDTASEILREAFLYYCMRHKHLENAPQADWFEKESPAIRSLLSYKQNLRYMLWLSLGLTAFLIVYSVTMLKFVPDWINYSWIHILHGFGIVGIFICFVSYLRVIHFALKNQDNKHDGRYWI